MIIMLSGVRAVHKLARMARSISLSKSVTMDKDMSAKVAAVTGANKGIGFAIVKGLLERFDGTVYLTSRDVGRGKAAVAKLNKLGLKPEYHQLDITDRNSISKFRDHIKANHGGLDILVNNAAIFNADDLYADYDVSKSIIDINYRGALTMQELIYPLVRDNGRILNISSDCGHLSNIRNKYWIERLSRKDMTVNDINEFVDWFLQSVKDGTFRKEDFADSGTVAAYRVAKTALSALTMVQQRELASRGISVNSMHPGLVATDMTLGVGFLSAGQAAQTPLKLLLETSSNVRGAYVWYDGKQLDWYDTNADYYFKSNTLAST